MSSIVDVIREILALTEGVRGLTQDIKLLTNEVRELRDRVLRLEEGEKLTVEKTRNAAIMAVTGVNGELLERLIAVESALGLQDTPRTPKVSRRRKQLRATSDQPGHATASIRS